MPLYLLDTELDENDPVDRWITARLYEGNPLTRLGQYGLLGIGGVRALRALGIEPGVLHFNEGHPALAALELAADDVAAGASLEDALAARARAVRLHDPHAGARGQRGVRARPPCATRSPTCPVGSGSTTSGSSTSAGRGPGPTSGRG